MAVLVGAAVVVTISLLLVIMFRGPTRPVCVVPHDHGGTIPESYSLYLYNREGKLPLLKKPAHSGACPKGAFYDPSMPVGSYDFYGWSKGRFAEVKFEVRREGLHKHFLTFDTPSRKAE